LSSASISAASTAARAFVTAAAQLGELDLAKVCSVAFQKSACFPVYGLKFSGPELITPPVVRCGYLRRNQPTSMPPYEPPKSRVLNGADALRRKLTMKLAASARA